MKEVCLLITIIRRRDVEEMETFFRKEGVYGWYSLPCNGTAHNKTLDLLGIEATEKTVLLCVQPGEAVDRITELMDEELHLYLPDRGICVAVPLSGIGGMTSLHRLMGEIELTEREDRGMNAEKELIITICEKGHTESIMNAARGAGAAGGTYIHAKGTAGTGNTKFLGITVAEEKEMVFIVTGAENRKPIMQAIMDRCCGENPPRAVVFSMPVVASAGFGRRRD